MKQRIITAIIALIIFVPFVIIGGMPFQLLVYAMATIGFVELIRMGKISKYSIPSILGIGLVWLILMQESNTDLTPLAWFTKSEVIMLMVLLLLSYTVLVKNKFTFDHAGVVLLSAIYVGMGFYYLIEARVGPESTDALATILYVFLIIWATDTGAYFFGRAFGKRKLWPKISPNKTVEGALGGVFLAIVVGVIFQAIHPIEDSFLAISSVSLLASIFGQIGDLVESAFKRHYEVKDSGNVLPGHGGILDRFDSLLFVMPILHLVGFFN
ncbi:phosphatidate cytidylyltransferase [Agaribacter marinus]|uniref:Phosphatidate cytidylyltransferase n=1 Tax=Virgibacillus salarius TaxID=447199 RepID=A0A941IB15_9BACI|nr:phosphatidate cytidylyltransferase [Virgibacillus salarius]MBR7794835.1 phosphatidate cytidylyltransferase [Virgibacillus salarius]NAZ07555.1 phosphatidate cytidylyltransferase [Agaribacter marinus]WBX79542.1 phosphatidate cytidylyltransferase [Virgibacillus salarius]